MVNKSDFESGLEVLQKKIIQDIQDILEGKSDEDIVESINMNFGEHYKQGDKE